MIVGAPVSMLDVGGGVVVVVVVRLFARHRRRAAASEGTRRIKQLPLLLGPKSAPI